MTSPLLVATNPSWTDAVIDNFDAFLLDHAAAEKKASGMAVSMLSHYTDKTELVRTMADLAVEELVHYREVVKWIHSRGLITQADQKDPYVVAFRETLRKGQDLYFMDRLLVASIIEARGAERFQLVADALEEPGLKRFYSSIARSEERHYETFLNLAYLYLPQPEVDDRWHDLLAIEAELVQSIPIRAALH